MLSYTNIQILSHTDTIIYTYSGMEEADQPNIIKDILVPFKMRKGRNRNCLWNYFTRCERQVFRNKDETVPIITKMIAKCNKCQIAVCTNLDIWPIIYYLEMIHGVERQRNKQKMS